MENSNLKKLSRTDLIEIIYQLKKNEQNLQAQLETVKSELEDKRIKINNAGSVAQAALEISEVFQATQKAADIYLEEIKCRLETVDEECQKKVIEAKKIAAEIIREANEEKEALDIQCKKKRVELTILKARINSIKSDGNYRG